MIGNLPIKGVSRPIAMTVTVAEVSVDQWGHECVAVAAHGEIDRKEFGLTSSQRLSPAASCDANRRVKIEIDIVAAEVAASAAG
jgi:polyisoprenoid-binding protein YceI